MLVGGGDCWDFSLDGELAGCFAGDWLRVVGHGAAECHDVSSCGAFVADAENDGWVVVALSGRELSVAVLEDSLASFGAVLLWWEIDDGSDGDVAFGKEILGQ